MEVASAIPPLRAYRKSISGSCLVALVPTMGALHEGHLSLIRAARHRADVVMASIFVNPTQFGPKEDLDQYPRPLGQDLALLQAEGVDLVFTPASETIYPAPSPFFLNINGLADRLCGASRPGHMNGVAQVVSILFNLFQPDLAFFGRKDYQQLAVIHRLAAAFHFPVLVVGIDTVRAPDGLALSSRNQYLDLEARQAAPFLYQTLKAVQAQKWNSAREAQNWASAQIHNHPGGFRLDYFEVLDGINLGPIDQIDPAFNPVAFVAAYLGNTRLIDNLALFSYPL